MKLFKKKGGQGKQQIKAGDYVVIRGKHWDDKTLKIKDGRVVSARTVKED